MKKPNKTMLYVYKRLSSKKSFKKREFGICGFLNRGHEPYFARIKYIRIYKFGVKGCTGADYTSNSLPHTPYHRCISAIRGYNIPNTYVHIYTYKQPYTALPPMFHTRRCLKFGCVLFQRTPIPIM